MSLAEVLFFLVTGKLGFSGSGDGAGFDFTSFGTGGFSGVILGAGGLSDGSPSA
jgi:hypothetical protein